MIAQSVVLVAQDPSVIEEIKGVTDSVAHLQLHTVATLAGARAHLESPELFLILVHLPQGADHEPLLTFLESAGQDYPRVSSLVLGEKNANGNNPALLRAGVTEYLEAPFEWGRLTFQVHNLARCARNADVTASGEASLELLGRDSFFYVLDPELTQMMELIRRVAPQD